MAHEHLPLRPLAHHYLSQSRRTYHEAIEGQTDVSRKRYLYALRPLLCCRWIEGHATPPPTAVADVIRGISLPEPVAEALDTLVAAKRSGAEGAVAPADLLLNDFIAEELTRLDAVIPSLPRVVTDDNALDALAWETLNI
jgi:predicted nucleotidyltransferase